MPISRPALAHAPGLTAPFKHRAVAGAVVAWAIGSLCAGAAWSQSLPELYDAARAYDAAYLAAKAQAESAKFKAAQSDSLVLPNVALNAGGSMLVGTLGRQIGLDKASVSDTRALGDSTLTVGKQLSPKFFVSYGVSLLGIGQVITLKYLLKKGLDITVESEQTDKREETSAALNWRK